MKVALTGKMRSGKDTIAEYAEKEYSMVRFAFGDPLKKGFHKAYPHIPKEPKPTRGYQLYGQLMRYVNGDDIFIADTFAKIDCIESVAKEYNILGDQPEFRPIITDVRQPNEVDRLVKEGYTLIRVNCPDKIRLERINASGDKYTLEDLNFETEKYIDSFKVDYDIHNDGTLEDLYAQVDKIFSEILGGE